MENDPRSAAGAAFYIHSLKCQAEKCCCRHSTCSLACSAVCCEWAKVHGSHGLKSMLLCSFAGFGSAGEADTKGTEVPIEEIEQVS